MENYFILRINYDKLTYNLNILFLLTHCLPINKINWIQTNKIRTFSKIKKFNNKFSSFVLKLNQWLKIFFIVIFIHRLLSSLIFVSVGTLMDGMMKNVVGIRYFNEIFKPICISLQEVSNSQYLNIHSNNYPFLCHYNTIFTKKLIQIYLGMRGLSISVTSFLFIFS